MNTINISMAIASNINHIYANGNLVSSLAIVAGREGREYGVYGMVNVGAKPGMSGKGTVI